MSRTTLRPLTYREHWQVQRAARKHLDPRAFFGWGVGLMFPFVFAASLLFAIVEWLFDMDQPTLILLRAVVLVVGFNAIVWVVYFKAIRPAIEKARAEFESRTATADSRPLTPGP